jgi:hypothetical protein
VGELLYKLGLRLSRFKYVQRAIDDRADLSEFRKRPTFRIFAGVFLICFSMTMSLPILVPAVTSLAIYFHHKWILALALPIYIFSHICYIAGMYLSGEKFVRIFFRWTTRCCVERLLSFAPAKEPAEL